MVYCSPKKEVEYILDEIGNLSEIRYIVLSQKERFNKLTETDHCYSITLFQSVLYPNTFLSKIFTLDDTNLLLDVGKKASLV